MNKYIELFQTICQRLELNAERAMEANKSNGKLEEYKNAKQMREDFGAVYDKITSNTALTKDDYATITKGTVVIINLLEKEIKDKTMVVDYYKSDILSKLGEVLKLEDGGEFSKKVEEIFSLND